MRPKLVAILLAICPACGSEEGAVLENSLGRCQDGVDNDDDGFVDCADQNCEIFAGCIGGTDTDQGADCADYCVHETDCVGGSTSECVDRCECEAMYVLRPDAAADYFACLTGASCSDVDPEGDCANAVRETIEPTDPAQAYLVACSDRRALACGRLDCEGHQLFTDGVLQALQPCLDAETCDAVLTCIDGILADAC